eukprot:gene43882-54526_t
MSRSSSIPRAPRASILSTLIEAAAAGLDIVSGLHTRLTGIPELVAAAAAAGVQLHDVRHGDWPRVTGTGRKRPGQRLLTVGTDCALGKKYTALALARSLQARGVPATFRATGQTGIMISGRGVAIDAVVADFIAGVAEQLSPDNASGHWDVIEGQGSLFHPAYAGVSLGLLHGSQPDALVLCHDPSRTHLDALPDYQTPRLANAIEMYLQAGRLTNPAVRCVGISVNSSSLGEAAWHAYRDRIEAELDLPVVDPIRGGVEALTAAIEPFEIARETMTAVDVLVVTLRDAHGLSGRGEAAGVTYDGETPQSIAVQIGAVAPLLRADVSHAELAHWLPAGGARNALDCALWDLRARQAGKRAWQMAGRDHAAPVLTAYTIGLGTEADVRRKIRAARHFPLLKLKADATRHVDMVRFAREEHPHARLVIDANQAWSRQLLEQILPELQAHGVELIEQP